MIYTVCNENPYMRGIPMFRKILTRRRNRRATKMFDALKNEAWHILMEQTIIVEWTKQYAL